MDGLEAGGARAVDGAVVEGATLGAGFSGVPFRVLEATAGTALPARMGTDASKCAAIKAGVG
jgi:hypothetical protein